MADAENPTGAVAKPKKTVKEFLESTPPGVVEDISDLSQLSGTHRVVAEPDVLLHCESDVCGGMRLFKCASDRIYFPEKGWKYGYATYVCRNCQKTSKVYAIGVLRGTGDAGYAYKFGENPPFGPHTPARVMTLIGEDRDLYLQGRRSENQGLGIGAFAYYRRVVENQKGRIIREIGRVAKRLGAKDSVLNAFEAAATETQFSTAIERIKDAIPQALLINGRNPLSLLHTALSEGLHEKEDAVCLDLAHSIRLVLTDLAERMSQVLKDQSELDQAVTKLLNRKSEKPGFALVETDKSTKP